MHGHGPEASKASLAEMNASQVMKYLWDAKIKVAESKWQEAFQARKAFRHTSSKVSLLKDATDVVLLKNRADKCETTPMMA
jgi:hypothetical protein